MITIEITALAYGGAGLGRDSGHVVFVPFTAPGDVVEVEILKEKKRYADGRLAGIIEPSALRVEPPCAVYGTCGGCDLQHIRYDDQVFWKQEIFRETLKRIGGLSLPPLDPPQPCAKQYHYRSKARFQIKGGRWGFFRRHSVDVVDISECPIVDPLINRAFARIRALMADEEVMHPLQGALSSLELGVSTADNRVVASFVLRRPCKGVPWKALLDAVDGLKGLEVSYVPGRARGRKDYRVGETELCYDTAGVSMSSQVSSFSQINRGQNERLIERVLEYASLKGSETVVELFSGAGNLTLHLGRAAGRVFAVDSDRAAIASAMRSAKSHGEALDGVEFFTMEAGKWLEENFKTLETASIDMVVLDPPRGGDSVAIEWLGRLRPRRIVYVSCAPPTMARDMKILAGAGYEVMRASMIDLFPQTGHIEGVALLSFGKKKPRQRKPVGG